MANILCCLVWETTTISLILCLGKDHAEMFPRFTQSFFYQFSLQMNLEISILHPMLKVDLRSILHTHTFIEYEPGLALPQASCPGGGCWLFSCPAPQFFVPIPGISFICIITPINRHIVILSAIPNYSLFNSNVYPLIYYSQH